MLSYPLLRYVLQVVCSSSKGLTLTPWSRVLLEMLTSKLCSQSRNSPHLWNPNVPHRTHKCPPTVPILSQHYPVPMTPSNFLKIRFNIILPSTFIGTNRFIYLSTRGGQGSQQMDFHDILCWLFLQKCYFFFLTDLSE